MKRTVLLAAICGCLLVGSLYPRLILEHHVKVIDESGNEVTTEHPLTEELPVKLEWRFLRILR